MAERNLAGKTLLMSGGSRGIGLAIAKRAAEDGAKVALTTLENVWLRLAMPLPNPG